MEVTLHTQVRAERLGEQQGAVVEYACVEDRRVWGGLPDRDSGKHCGAVGETRWMNR